MRHKFMSKRGKGMIHRKELERIRNVLIDRKNDLENELTTLPEGSLYCAKIKGCWYYYQLLPKQGNRKKEKRLGISNDTDKIFALVRKQYINKALALVEKDIKVLEMAIKHYVDIDEESVMEKFLEKHPELSAGIMHGHQRDEEWAEAYDRQEDFFAEERKHTSLRGEAMLSKNELYIASRLDHYGIPYRYECDIPHPDTDRVPDFTIRRPRDGKIIYWEHLGLTGDDSYMKGNELKFVEYADIEIVPWDNLIVTYDTPDGGIDGKIIEAMIQGWLL